MRYFVNSNQDNDQNVGEFDKSFWSTFLINKINEILCHVSSNARHADGGIYVGSPGVAYALWYVTQKLGDDVIKPESKHQLLKQAYSYCESFFRINPPRDPETSFLCGAAGVHVTAALIARALKDENICLKHVNAFKAIGPHLEPVAFLPQGSDELFVGRAGYVMAALHLNRYIENSVDENLIRRLTDSMIKSGLNYAKKNRSVSPLMYSYYRSEYLGAAHGLAGILQALLYAEKFSHFSDNHATIKRSVDFLLSPQIRHPDGNYASDMDEVNGNPNRRENQLVHWCHGAPGIVYCLAMASRRFNDEKYADAIFEAGDIVWQRGLLRKGPGICHGVAGNGYVHLLCYRLATSQQQRTKYLNRAFKFCQFLGSEEFKHHARTPDCPWSLYEGWAGTICYISDLVTNPDRAEFPFSDVFSY